MKPFTHVMKTTAPAPVARKAAPAPNDAAPVQQHHPRVDAKHPRDPDEREPPKKRAERPLDALDPTVRNPALLAPPMPPAPATIEATEAPRARMSMEELLPALVRRIAWAGDKHKGTVRLELGAGAHAGTTMLVHAEGGRVRVEVSGPGDLDALRRAIDERLRGHGLDVESVT